MRLVDRVVMISPKDITPFHEEVHPSYTKMLASDMVKKGWRGRPIVVMDLPDGTLKGLTGSHRVRAAVKAKLKSIPVIKLTSGERKAVLSEFPWFHKNRMDVWSQEGDAPVTGDVAGTVYETGSHALADLIAIDEHAYPIDKMTPALRRKMIADGFTEEVFEVL